MFKKLRDLLNKLPEDGYKQQVRSALLEVEGMVNIQLMDFAEFMIEYNEELQGKTIPDICVQYGIDFDLSEF